MTLVLVAIACSVATLIAVRAIPVNTRSLSSQKWGKNWRPSLFRLRPHLRSRTTDAGQSEERCSGDPRSEAVADDEEASGAVEQPTPDLAKHVGRTDAHGQSAKATETAGPVLRSECGAPPQAHGLSARVEPADLPGPVGGVLPPRGTNPPIAWLKALRGVALDLLLTRDQAVIGRASECEIVLDEETVSRRHCSLLFRSGRWFIRAFETPNGTFVNETLLPPERLVQLESQDVIGIGRQISLRLTTPQDERVPLKLSTGAATSRGGRDRNEDHHLANATTISVADGVGGRPAGALASKIAIDMLRGAPENLSLRQLMPAIEAAVRARGAGDPASENMATTLDAAQLVEEERGYRMYGIHIGDGLAIVDDGTQLRQLTTAHTLGSQLASQRNPASARHPERTRLLRAIGLHKVADVDAWDERAVLGNRYILSTDGLIDALGVDQFSRVLLRMRGADPQQAAATLVDFGLRSTRIPAGELDNLTVVMADIVSQARSERHTDSGDMDHSYAELTSARRPADLVGPCIPQVNAQQGHYGAQ
jgi:serine/threonine protein phosphatase PrpC